MHVLCLQARRAFVCLGAGEPDEAGDLGEQAALADLLSRERQLRDRNSQLLVPHKSFRSVLHILDQAQVCAAMQALSTGLFPSALLLSSDSGQPAIDLELWRFSRSCQYHPLVHNSFSSQKAGWLAGKL